VACLSRLLQEVAGCDGTSGGVSSESARSQQRVAMGLPDAFLEVWVEPPAPREPAVRFARRHHADLAARPVWLFSSGPIGTDQVDAQGQDVRISTRPKEWEQLVPLIRPRGEQVFFGAFDPTTPPVGLGERLIRRLPAATNTLPAGDFRDWDAIDDWAAQIATNLSTGAT